MNRSPFDRFIVTQKLDNPSIHKKTFLNQFLLKFTMFFYEKIINILRNPIELHLNRASDCVKLLSH